MRPYKFRDTWIDLDHVLAITDAGFINQMGFGGWYVGFQVVMAFRDKPLVFERELTKDEQGWDHDKKSLTSSATPYLFNVDGSRSYKPDWNADHKQFLCVSRVQSEVDKLIEAWRSK
jgi:hypothetical protein